MMTHRQLHSRRRIDPAAPGYRESVTAAAFMVYRALLVFDIHAVNVVCDSTPCVPCLVQAVAQIGLALARHGETEEQALGVNVAAVLEALEPAIMQLAHGDTAVIHVPASEV